MSDALFCCRVQKTELLFFFFLGRPSARVTCKCAIYRPKFKKTTNEAMKTLTPAFARAHARTQTRTQARRSIELCLQLEKTLLITPIIPPASIWWLYW